MIGNENMSDAGLSFVNHAREENLVEVQNKEQYPS